MEAIQGNLREKYSGIGKVLSVQPAASKQSSNEHFLVITTEGRFFLKQMRNPDALYGSLGMDRIRMVCEVLKDLSSSPIRVEKLIPADKENYFEHEGSVFRLYRFLEGAAFSGGEKDLLDCADLLGRFHREGRAYLRNETLAGLKRFTVSYPLATTWPQWAEIQKFAGHSISSWSDEISDFYHEFSDPPQDHSFKTLVHLDFHPENVLFGAQGPTLIDLDNVLWEESMRCAAFSLLRFVPFDALLGDGEKWLARYGYALGKKVAPMQQFVHWMGYIELEKILRILYRFSQTGEYGRFLENIEKRHLPNLRKLAALKQKL